MTLDSFMRQLLKQRINVNRPGNTSDSSMGVTPAPVTVYTSIAASIQPATSSVQNFYAQRQLKVSMTVFVAGSLDLQRGDVVTDGAVNYQVIGWRDLSGRGKVMAIDCEVFE